MHTNKKRKKGSARNRNGDHGPRKTKTNCLEMVWTKSKRIFTGKNCSASWHHVFYLRKRKRMDANPRTNWRNDETVIKPN